MLSAINPIWELVVGDHMVELRGRLVVPGTPGGPAIHRDGRALIAGQQDDFGMFGIDPDGVIIVAAGRAFDGRESLPCVRRAIRGSVRHVDDVFVLGIHAHAGEVGSAPGNALLRVHALPGCSRVVGAIECARFRFHQRVHAVRIRGCDPDANPSEPFRRSGKPTRELLPGAAAIRGFEKPARGTTPFAVFPRPLARCPQNRVDIVGIGGIECQIYRAGVLILIKHLLPSLAAVGGAKHAALHIGTIRMAKHGHENAVRIARVHQNRRNLLSIPQSKMPPGFARIGGFVHSVANREIRPLHTLAAANINDIRLRRSDSDCTD